MEPIKTKEDLKRLLKFLDQQGFGYFSEWELHQKKIDHILSQNNKLGINYDKKFKEKMFALEDYDVVEKQTKEFFSKFNVDDKIFEYTQTFSVNSDDDVHVPSYKSDAKTIIAWVKFKEKYNLSEIFKQSDRIYFYNLDKNYLKINFGSYKEWEFKQMYKYIFNEEPAPFDDKVVGKWFNLGKIEIKFWAKGGANIKGPGLRKYQEYYNRFLKDLDDRYYSCIIKFNGKLEIIEQKRRN